MRNEVPPSVRPRHRGPRRVLVFPGRVGHGASPRRGVLDGDQAGSDREVGLFGSEDQPRSSPRPELTGSGYERKNESCSWEHRAADEAILGTVGRTRLAVYRGPTHRPSL
jgi:hypothetical protein